MTRASGGMGQARHGDADGIGVLRDPQQATGRDLPPPAPRPGRATRAVPWAILAVFILTPALGWTGSPQTVGTPDHLRVVVAVPADHRVDPLMLRTVEHEADLAVTWLQRQTNMELRGDAGHGRIVRLEVTTKELAGSTVEAVQTIMAEVVGRLDRNAFPIVITPAGTATPLSGPQTCARGWAQGMVVLLGNCPSRAPSMDSTWPSPLSRTIAHELVHGLGGVQDCAPNATYNGHVEDDPSDLMYDGPAPSGRITLDADRADYFGHANDGCADITDSPLWLGQPPSGGDR